MVKEKLNPRYEEDRIVHAYDTGNGIVTEKVNNPPIANPKPSGSVGNPKPSGVVGDPESSGADDTTNTSVIDTMVSDTDKWTEEQINVVKDWETKQTEIQNQQNNFTIDQINQQKEKAEKDYLKEQTGAYVDWQRQSAQHGVNAEKMASIGMGGTGYAESSQVAMYNQYQNRVATARENIQLAIQSYDNAITQAQLQNSSALAEIAYQALQKRLELSLEGFQYKNDLLLEKENMRITEENIYQKVMDEINAENDNTKIDENANIKIGEDGYYYETYDGGETWVNTGTKATNEETPVHDPANGYISNEWYQGKTNPDVEEFGAFSNGYQPKGIHGSGKVSHYKDRYGQNATFEHTTEVVYGASKGKKMTVVQSIWVTPDDGKLWYWEGRENKYKPFPPEE